MVALLTWESHSARAWRASQLVVTVATLPCCGANRQSTLALPAWTSVLAFGPMSALFSAREVRRAYRFVDRSGQPHPILDDHFESLDGAWEAAQAWLGHRGLSAAAMPAALAEEFGIEVTTANGHWRTLRHPGQGSLVAVPGLDGPAPLA